MNIVFDIKNVTYESAQEAERIKSDILKLEDAYSYEYEPRFAQLNITIEGDNVIIAD